MDINQLEYQKKFQIKKIKNNLKDLWNNVKHNSIHIIGESQKKREYGSKKCIWENYSSNISEPEEGKRHHSKGNTKGPK